MYNQEQQKDHQFGPSSGSSSGSDVTHSDDEDPKRLRNETLTGIRRRWWQTVGRASKWFFAAVDYAIFIILFAALFGVFFGAESLILGFIDNSVHELMGETQYKETWVSIVKPGAAWIVILFFVVHSLSGAWNMLQREREQEREGRN